MTHSSFVTLSRSRQLFGLSSCRAGVRCIDVLARLGGLLFFGVSGVSIDYTSLNGCPKCFCRYHPTQAIFREKRSFLTPVAGRLRSKEAAEG